MFFKPVFILILAFSMLPVQERQANEPVLPEDLSETEMQSILRQKNPKSHVEATLKVSEKRADNASLMIEQSRFKAAAQDVDVYAALIRYADVYTRKLPSSKSKDRNRCLKKIEQAIFKETRTLEAVLRQMPYNLREATERSVNEVKEIRLRAINDLLGGGKVINSSN